MEHHISDIECIVRELNLNKFYIMGNSRGVSYQLGYAILNSEKLNGLIVVEYPPQHKKC